MFSPENGNLYIAMDYCESGIIMTVWLVKLDNNKRVASNCMHSTYFRQVAVGNFCIPGLVYTYVYT